MIARSEYPLLRSGTMDLDWSEDERAFPRRPASLHRRAHAAPGWTHHERDMPDPAIGPPWSGSARPWAEEGLLTPHWPTEYGGQGGVGWEQTIVSEELWAAGEPRGPQYMNVNWIGPAIMLAGRRAEGLPSGPHLPGRGHVVPGVLRAGRRLGPRVADARPACATATCTSSTGQKIWTSYAHAAEYCRPAGAHRPGDDAERGHLPPARPHGPCRHRGTRHPQPVGQALVHEMWFTDVAVPVSCRLGAQPGMGGRSSGPRQRAGRGRPAGVLRAHPRHGAVARRRAVRT